jgi:two-component sensor histidine kinase
MPSRLGAGIILTVFSIKMEQDKEKNQYELTLSNTGSPFPEDIDIDNPQTLGLQFISALTAQLGGTGELQREPNMVCTIRFPIVDVSLI